MGKDATVIIAEAKALLIKTIEDIVKKIVDIIKSITVLEDESADNGIKEDWQKFVKMVEAEVAEVKGELIKLMHKYEPEIIAQVKKFKTELIADSKLLAVDLIRDLIKVIL